MVILRYVEHVSPTRQLVGHGPVRSRQSTYMSSPRRGGLGEKEREKKKIPCAIDVLGWYKQKQPPMAMKADKREKYHDFYLFIYLLLLFLSLQFFYWT